MRSKYALTGMMVLGCFFFATSTFAQNGQFEITNNTDCAVKVQMDIREGSTICNQGSFCTLTTIVAVPALSAIAINPQCGTNAYWAKAIFYSGGNQYSVDCDPNPSAGSPNCSVTNQPMTFNWVNSNVATVDY